MLLVEEDGVPTVPEGRDDSRMLKASRRNGKLDILGDDIFFPSSNRSIHKRSETRRAN